MASRPASASEDTNGGHDDSLAAVAALLRGRRTIKTFRQDAVPRDLLLAAIEAARWAPNHRLTEPWRFYLLGDRTVEKLTDLAVDIAAESQPEAKTEAAAAARRARLEAIPGWLVVTCNRSDDSLLQREDYAACCCAIQNLMLYLWHAGVGVKWTTGAVTRDARLYPLLGIDPANEDVVGLFWYGYPEKVPERKRRSVAEITTELP